jgi:hypothetical protein
MTKLVELEGKLNGFGRIPCTNEVPPDSGRVYGFYRYATGLMTVKTRLLTLLRKCLEYDRKSPQQRLQVNFYLRQILLV